MKESVIDHLSELGFSGAEAAVYVALLQEPKATGYRIARLAGKPVPNTYKALDALHKKGAIIVDESGRGRTYTALPVGEFFEGMKRRLDTMRGHLEEELKGLTAGAVEGGIYQLNTPDQVYGRAKTMLREAKGVALVDIFPRPLVHLRGDLEAAAKLKYGKIEELKKQLADAEEALAKSDRAKLIQNEVTAEQIADVVAKWTGIPVVRLLSGERERLMKMEEAIRARVIGQDEAVQAVADAVVRARAGIQDP